MKLEIKVQVPGSSPRDAEFRDVLLRRPPRAPSRRPREFPERELSAEIEFYPSYAVFKERVGTCGADRVRTDDIQLAKLALSQLSYSPRKGRNDRRHPTPRTALGLGGLEPPTSRLSGARSSQLSYRPARALHIPTRNGKERASRELGLSKPDSKSLVTTARALKPFETAVDLKSTTPETSSGGTGHAGARGTDPIPGSP